jgi:hypothetical protein
MVCKQFPTPPQLRLHLHNYRINPPASNFTTFQHGISYTAVHYQTSYHSITIFYALAAITSHDHHAPYVHLYHAYNPSSDEIHYIWRPCYTLSYMTPQHHDPLRFTSSIASHHHNVSRPSRSLRLLQKLRGTRFRSF